MKKGCGIYKYRDKGDWKKDILTNENDIISSKESMKSKVVQCQKCSKETRKRCLTILWAERNITNKKEDEHNSGR